MHGCIDAETLAAWTDGGLSKADAAVVETHLADCDRCAAMLATFVRTAPEAPVAESLWKRWHLRWLVPIATAATVAAVWVLVPRPDSPRTATLNDQVTSAPQARAASAPPPPAASENKEQETRQRAQVSGSRDTFAKREESQSAAAPQPQQLAKSRADADSRVQPPQSPGETAGFAPTAPAREADVAEKIAVDAERTPAAPQQPPANAAAAAPPPAPAGITLESAARRQAASNRTSAAPIIEVASPDPMTRWRVIGAGQVERTTTGGSQWQRATLPESATLTAGSSPSPTICWLVARTGSIYVTTDGLRFVRVPFPDRTDFVSIQAIDGRRATVVTIDGRTMRTDDQGANWIRINP